MQNIITTIIILLGINHAMANTYQHCQTLHGELEFIVPLNAQHLFIAPHSLTSSQRQIASLKKQPREDVKGLETLQFTSLKSEHSWSQHNLSFKSDFHNYLEVALNDGKTHTFSLKCTQF